MNRKLALVLVACMVGVLLLTAADRSPRSRFTISAGR